MSTTPTTAAPSYDDLVQALLMIQHATAPKPDDGGHHEAAYDLATDALSGINKGRLAGQVEQQYGKALAAEARTNLPRSDPYHVDIVLMPLVKMLATHGLSWSEREQIGHAMMATIHHHKSMLEEMQAHCASMQQPGAERTKA